MPYRRNPKPSSRRPVRGATDVVRASQPIPFPATYAGPEVKFLSYGANDQQLYHNVPVALANAASLLDSVVSGTTQYQRVGNSIILRKLCVNFLMNTKDNRPNVSYRIVITATPNLSASADSFSEQFGVNGTVSNMTASPIPGITRVYLDKVIPGGQYSVTPLTSGGTNKERTQIFRASVRMNAPVRYNSDGTATTALKVWVIAYDAYGTLTTDNIASIPNSGFGIYFTDD